MESHDAETIVPATKASGDRVPTAPSKPTRIGRYRLEKKLGSGGMGTVHEAVETDTGRRVAVKILSSNLTRDAAHVDRFVREGRLAAQLSHPRTTFIYEAGEDNGQPYIAMELMPGTTLQDELVANGPLPTTTAVDFIIDVIDGLIAAHKLNFIHRDVKPSNCFIDTDGRVKIGDFGLSKNLVTDVDLTRTGAFMGTPSFAAPEQIRGGEVDHRTDIYAVGATLYMLIADRPPFVGDALNVTAQIVSDKPQSLNRLVKGVPKDLAKIVDVALSKNPAERFQDLESMRRCLTPFASKGTALAAIGRRTGAYMLDYLMISIALQIVMMIFGALTGAQASIIGREGFNERVAFLQNASSIAGWIMLVLYFTIAEGWWGRSVGKKILGLRVINKDNEKPGFLRAGLRSFVVPGAFGVPLLAIPVREMILEESIIMVNVLVLWGFERLTEILPMLLCILTMRVSNGCVDCTNSSAERGLCEWSRRLRPSH